MRPILLKRRVLQDTHQPCHRDLPPVSVVIAAKDEEDNIESCLRSVLAQDYPDLEVIIVDDRSTDRTPRILAGLQSRFSDRLRVVTVTHLSEGWFGKCNAMREGIAEARGEWLLFSDADCQFTSPRALRLAMTEVLEQELDFLTMAPQLTALVAWERFIQPVCVIVLMVWFQPNRVNNPAKKTAYANGAFMLMSRRCYDGVGGHAAVRNRLNEDIDLARLAKSAGFRLRVVENRGLLSSRMYASFVHGFRGWSRIFCGALRSPARLAVAFFSVVLFSVAPWLGLLLSAVLASASIIVGWEYALLAWAAAVIAQHACVWRVYGVLNVARAWSFLYFAGAVVTTLMLANGFLKSIGATRTTWRSTTYRNDQIVAPASSPKQPLATPTPEQC